MERPEVRRDYGGDHRPVVPSSEMMVGIDLTTSYHTPFVEKRSLMGLFTLDGLKSIGRDRPSAIQTD